MQNYRYDHQTKLMKYIDLFISIHFIKYIYNTIIVEKLLQNIKETKTEYKAISSLNNQKLLKTHKILSFCVKLKYYVLHRIVVVAVDGADRSCRNFTGDE